MPAEERGGGSGGRMGGKFIEMAWGAGGEAVRKTVVMATKGSTEVTLPSPRAAVLVLLTLLASGGSE